MKLETKTEPEAVLSLLPGRVEEFNAMYPDRRCRMTCLKAQDGQIRIRVRDGYSPSDALDFVGELTETEDGSLISGVLSPDPEAGRRRVGAFLYGILVSSLARLTVLLLLYGAVLGISFLVGGRSFLLPALPSAAVAVVMLVRAVRIRRGLPRRVSEFFRSFLGCTERAE